MDRKAVLLFSVRFNPSVHSFSLLPAIRIYVHAHHHRDWLCKDTEKRNTIMATIALDRQQVSILIHHEYSKTQPTAILTKSLATCRYHIWQGYILGVLQGFLGKGMMMSILKQVRDSLLWDSSGKKKKKCLSWLAHVFNAWAGMLSGWAASSHLLSTGFLSH